MTADGRVLRAVRNNAEWCDAVCRAHRVPGEFQGAFWLNRGQVPPYTSKLITLAPDSRAEQLVAIQSLVYAESQSYFSVKDAFQCLDLGSIGFEVLFQATWIHWQPGTELPVDAAEQLSWSVVRGSEELTEWEQAWRGSAANAGVNGQPRVFMPSLLDELGVSFLAGKRDGSTLASAVLNRTGDVVGLSNVFTGVEGIGPLFPGCVRLAQELHPGVPIVGYERGADLAAAERAGFAGIHGLTVWQRSPQ